MKINDALLQTGLTEAQVRESEKSHGRNQLTQKKSKSFFQRFLSNLNDPIIRILFFAMLISAFLLLQDGCLSEVLGIGAAILLSTLVSTASECGSERAFQRLRAEGGQATCTVLRNDTVQVLPLDALVVGDVVLLEAGECIPADGYLVEGNLTLDLSALNGESKAAHKTASRLCAQPLTAELSNGLLRGSSVTGGKGKMCVSAVGDQTLYGSMARELQEEGRESPLKRKLSRLARTISRIGYLSAALVMAADLIYSFAVVSAPMTPVYIAQNLIHAFTLGITVIVMAVPEGLPMMITVVLSANTRRMLKNHVLVRKGIGIETSGGIQMLFTDKTGTITCGQPKFRACLLGDGTEVSSFSKLGAELQTQIALCARWNTSAVVAGKEIRGGNAMDQLLFAQVQHLRLPLNAWRRLALLPFQSENRYSAATVTDGKQTITFYKGAPELLLPACRDCLDRFGNRIPFAQREAVLQRWHQLARQGARTIVLASAPTERLELGGELTFLALLRIEDVVRKEAKGAVSDLHRAGVQVVMITGDHPDTAVAIAKECGILQKEGTEAVLTGAQLQALSDAQVAQALPKLRVVARAMPTDKSRLVRIAQGENLVVGMTGDGLNDAPALKTADVGFAMASGTQVTKEAADIVILDNNIASVTCAVLYGRTIFRSIRKFITFQLTMNFCAVLISMLAPFLSVDTPITVMQMLWINLIMDTLAGLAFAGEAPDPAYLKTPPIQRDTPVLTREMGMRIAGMGLGSLLLCLLALKNEQVQLWLCGTTQQLTCMTVFFTLFVFCGVCCAFYARSERIGVLSRLFQNKTFFAVMGVVLAVQIGMVAFGGSLFRTTPLPWQTFLRVLGFSALVLPMEWLRRVVVAVFVRNGKSR